jgi:hypothetical protein
MRKNASFETTLDDSRRLTTYALAMGTLTHSVTILQERGADPLALKLFFDGIKLLLRQLETGAHALENRGLVERLLKDLRRGTLP